MILLQVDQSSLYVSTNKIQMTSAGKIQEFNGKRLLFP